MDGIYRQSPRTCGLQDMDRHQRFSAKSEICTAASFGKPPRQSAKKNTKTRQSGQL